MESEIFTGELQPLETAIGGGIIDGGDEEDLGLAVDKLIEKLGGFKKILAGGGNEDNSLSMFGVGGAKSAVTDPTDLDITEAIE